MSQTKNNAQGQKPRISALAIASIMLTMPIVLQTVIWYLSYPRLLYIPCFVDLLSLVLALVGLSFAGISLFQISRSNGRLKGRAFAASGIIGVVMASFVWVLPPPRGPHSYDVYCTTNMRSLKTALDVYNYDNSGRHPPVDKWCDLLITEGYVLQNSFRCPGDTQGPCSYAINPNATPNSAPDMVLLFETKGGWNQSGGPEMVYTDNHHDKRHWFWGYKLVGSHIVFNDGRVEFVTVNRVAELKWNVEDSDIVGR